MSKARIIGASTLFVVTAIVVPIGSHFEQNRPIGYLDAVGQATDCLGETNGAVVGVMRHTLDECLALYNVRLVGVWNDHMSNCIHTDLTPNQAAAVVLWADNVGINAACGSTLVRYVNAGAAPNVWCSELPRWNKGRVLGQLVVLPGLSRRRACEYQLCLGQPVSPTCFDPKPKE